MKSILTYFKGRFYTLITLYALLLLEILVLFLTVGLLKIEGADLFVTRIMVWTYFPVAIVNISIGFMMVSTFIYEFKTIISNKEYRFAYLSILGISLFHYFFIYIVAMLMKIIAPNFYN